MVVLLQLVACWAAFCFSLAAREAFAADPPIVVQPEPNSEFQREALFLPPTGWTCLRAISPTWLELTAVTSDNPVSSRGLRWDFVSQDGVAHLPEASSFKVLVEGRPDPVTRVGFRRRVIYAPLKQRDLRIGNYLYLELSQPAAEGARIEVTNPNRKLWTAPVQFACSNALSHWSAVIHVNQTGYLPRMPKKAMLGYYLGSAGELALSNAPTGLAFQLLEAPSGKVAFSGTAALRPDQGFPYPCYQQVYEADFSQVQNPGEYLLHVPGLGNSSQFRIGEEVAGALARADALGIYHQRCGAANQLPYTRFTHNACHTAKAEVPDSSSKFKSVNESLAKESSNYKDNPRHTAPQLKNVSASLYPFVRKSPVDVSGGHHDAGDYSKYTMNSAAFIHYLVISADVLPGVADLDNLGLPESGDGKSDVLQEAKWEADFLAKMQDDDGGFYFLVYPRDREYEIDVLPDHGDPQVVFPKTTSATAAAVAALAQCSSSPAFRKQFPEASAAYLEKARKGWRFLEQAIARHGKDGAYQKITHYGDLFMHDDELAWAACEMFLATHDTAFERKLMEWFNPADPETRRWGWWRLSEAYGCAARSYAFSVKSGRMKTAEINPLLLEGCENEVAAAGEDQLKRARQSAYGTSFPEETKRAFSAGWYFSGDAAFDLAMACQVAFPVKRDPRPAMREAVVSNLNYEQGCNPVNVDYLTGMGWKRQREIVHQYAQNDRRVLPPTGIPLGNIQGGFGWNYVYNSELDKLSFPSDGSKDVPYPFYDRWGDGFNLSQEFVILNQAKELGVTCWLMAETSLRTQAWKSATVKLEKKAANTFELANAPMDLSNARVTWEAERQQPAFGSSSFSFPGGEEPGWCEAEAELPDGRRLFGVWEGTSR